MLELLSVTEGIDRKSFLPNSFVMQRWGSKSAVMMSSTLGCRRARYCLHCANGQDPRALLLQHNAANAATPAACDRATALER